MDATPDSSQQSDPAETTPGPDTVTISSVYLTQLENTRREYGVTINTLAIVTEKLLEATGGGDTLYIDPATRLKAPDLRAGVSAEGQIWIKVTR